MFALKIVVSAVALLIVGIALLLLFTGYLVAGVIVGFGGTLVLSVLAIFGHIVNDHQETVEKSETERKAT